MKYAPFVPLETQRLILRQLSMEDLYDYYEKLFGDGDVMKYLCASPHQDIGESLAGLEKALARYEEGNFYRWAVERKAEPGLVGIIQLLRFDEERSECSFAYQFAKEVWNQGYATEAMTEVFRFAFEELEIRRIEAEHFSKNGASGAVMRKLGMTHIGTAVGKYVKNGQKVDTECYELVRGGREPLTANDYQNRAMETLNPALSQQDVLLNGVMGLCGEAGEVIDIVKKHLHQGHALDREKLIRELGDVAWYLAETSYALGVPLEEVLRQNLEKLRNRYPAGFDREKSVNRG